MAGELKGHAVAVLATDGVEQVELTTPLQALKEAGAEVQIVSPRSNTLEGWNHHDRGDVIHVDQPLDQADPARYDALVLPGGVVNPDELRTIPKAVAFVRHFAETGKPIAAICHGPWMLIEADAVRGRKVTSWPSLRTDLRNAGAEWTDAEVVTDKGLVTSRNPRDLPAFCVKMVEEFREGRHPQRAANDPSGMRRAG